VPGAEADGGSPGDGFFHSGRRASDGLATHADILKLQQLMKTRGVPEMQKELQLPVVTPSPAALDPRQSARSSRRTELRHGRPVHQHSFEEGFSGRLSPFRSAAFSFRSAADVYKAIGLFCLSLVNVVDK